MGSPAAPPTSSASTIPTPGNVQLGDLQRILGNMGAGGTGAATPCDLSEAMKPEDLIPMLANENVRKSLVEHLPDAANIPKTEAELKETIHSPQFQQACSAFSNALATGQLGPVLAQFGVSAAAVEAANKGDVAAFAKAMEEAALKSEEEKMETD